MADDLEARLVGVIHQEERDAVVGGEVAGGDVLLVAGEVGEGEGAAVEDMQEAGGAAAVLNVRPAVFGDGTEIEAVAGGDELLLEVAECFVARTEGGKALVLGAGVMLLLQALGCRGEHCLCELASHSGLWRLECSGAGTMRRLFDEDGGVEGHSAAEAAFEVALEGGDGEGAEVGGAGGGPGFG